MFEELEPDLFSSWAILGSTPSPPRGSYGRIPMVGEEEEERERSCAFTMARLERVTNPTATTANTTTTTRGL